MNASRILGLDDLVFVEPSFADLTEDIFTEMTLSIPAQEARLLVDEEENLLALALCDGTRWTATTFLFRRPISDVVSIFEELGGEIYQEDREVWLAAVREYFALQIQHHVTSAIEDLPPDRGGLIDELVREVWGTQQTVRCLDCGCGSGVGSAVLRSLGMAPLSYDNDPALLSLGLSQGRLLPQETMCIDGTVASRYLAPVPRGASFMLGAINAFTREIWSGVVSELLALTDENLITVGTEEECTTVAGWCREGGRETETFENDRDPIYDRWVCRAWRP
jgi:hypothetical protein